MNYSKKVYIIGIGGISLSALAVLLRDRGASVKGSDLTDGERVEALKRKGFEVVVGHSREFVSWADEIIISSAVPENDEDLIFAKKLGKKIITRAEALGDLSKIYKTISVSGCHGKTTTTGMIASVMLGLEKKPSIHIGGLMVQIHDNVYEGNSEYFVTEACEYKDSFLKLTSEVGVILNIKPDHLDYFKNFNNVKKSFYNFAQNIKSGGTLIVNGDDLSCKELLDSFVGKCKLVTFGMGDGCVFKATDVEEYSTGKYRFSCETKNGRLVINLPVYGFHNIYNALATVATCISVGVSVKEIKRGIESFKGISRRFEKVYDDENKIVIHDYAHHPDEIKAAIEAGRKLKKGKLIVVFQPHTFSRTRDFFNGFCESLSLADEVWLLPIYPAREKPIKNVSSYKIYRKLKENGKKTRYFANFSSVYDEIRLIKDNCLVLILGAGDIEFLARMIEKKWWEKI